jgi:hypothetical protein
MVVEVRGQIDSRHRGVATQIRVVSEARGVVQSVSPPPAARRARRARQVSAATVFEGWVRWRAWRQSVVEVTGSSIAQPIVVRDQVELRTERCRASRRTA